MYFEIKTRSHFLLLPCGCYCSCVTGVKRLTGIWLWTPLAAVGHATETWPICHLKVLFLLWRQTFTGEFVEQHAHILGSELRLWHKADEYIYFFSLFVQFWDSALGNSEQKASVWRYDVNSWWLLYLCCNVVILFCISIVYSSMVLRHFHCNCLIGMDQLQALLLSAQEKLELGVRGDRLEPMTPQNHVLTQLIIRCLHNNPKKRPSAQGEIFISY